ncbi:MAG: RdgB/HAM1 family non-canonical purine NTP pyrophosphatase [Planctomycetes bacterium]|nr:RdgB/HAM1 family non-canonical purine NTP pyrophosphatase [Planctomycetota bacterium]
MKEILFASGNEHKITELREILAPYNIAVKTSSDCGGLPKVIEDGDTFAANAIKKAESAMQHSGLPALSDDSGIEARALGGRPGVYSARYAGEQCDDHANNIKLSEELADKDDKHVQYRCVIALARPNEQTLTWDGCFPGLHVAQARGENGFGYDPYVFIEEAGVTVAEMCADEKHRRSHRGQAMRAFMEWLQQQSESNILSEQ